ncbi:DUF86 domain-containing protein [Sulfurimonas sp.]|uniref:HepT-like ribonuclease domain-containing protein n=1 Tax=Sulfurimonas sp. TaxID=2022749 RepID=UPI002AB17A58|nr:HepT-like ribonuclease domain-containing protein [Sulfurimonas sp.]
MSNRVYELFLFDIYIAILKIEHVSSKFSDSESLKHDFVSWDSVIREFEIVGEATSTLIKNEVLSKENQIIVDFRNLLIHHYFGIDSEEIWNVIKNDLLIYKNLIILKIQNIENNLKNELLTSLKDENKHLNFILHELSNIK